MELHQLGWNPFFQAEFNVYSDRGLQPGRVAGQQKGLYTVFCQIGTVQAEVSGRFRFQCIERGEYPAVGDWVAVGGIAADGGRARIEGVLPRLSSFSRRTAGKTIEEQVIAANITWAFLVCALNGDFNPRRIERYLTLVWESGAGPVILLSKADLCSNAEDKAAGIQALAPEVPVHIVSAATGRGLDGLAPYFKPGSTSVLLGSSGSGKSTLINKLLGFEVQKTAEVRCGDDKGRHTTTSRTMLILPGGGLIIDTPGLREIQLWHTDSGLESTFRDIGEMEAGCRFRDCRHENEPGCAVLQALEDGLLEPQRYENYLKMRRELDFLDSRTDKKSFLERKAKHKELCKMIKQTKKTGRYR